MIRGVIFDLDGTLTNTLPMCIRLFQQTLSPLVGRELSSDEIVATFGPSEEGTIRQLAPDHYQQALDTYLTLYEQNLLPESGPFAGTLDWLDSLHVSPLRLALVTGKGPLSTPVTLERYGLAHYFEKVATGSPEGVIKTQHIANIVADWQLPADEVIYVGDALSDVIAAKAAGVKMLSAAWVLSEQEIAEVDAHQPEFIARSVADARDWLAAQVG